MLYFKDTVKAEFSGRNLTAVLKLFNIESSLKFPNTQCFNTRTTIISNYD